MIKTSLTWHRPSSSQGLSKDLTGRPHPFPTHILHRPQTQENQRTTMGDSASPFSSARFLSKQSGSFWAGNGRLSQQWPSLRPGEGAVGGLRSKWPYSCKWGEALASPCPPPPRMHGLGDCHEAKLCWCSQLGPSAP